MNERIRGNEYRYFTVCVDKRDGSIMYGRLYNAYLNGGQEFSGLMDLILKVDALLNEMGNVQQGVMIRSFRKSTDADEVRTSDDRPANGALATFNIKRMFRQAASWQGTVLWQEGRAEESFRSVLELAMLMNSTFE